jgi:hypothetical protein
LDFIVMEIATSLRFQLVTLLIAVWTPPTATRAITVGETDAFSANTEGWQQGKPANLRATSGGPAGANDAYLRIGSNGSNDEHGKVVVFNGAQWAGNYLSAGVNAISMNANNFGASNLTLRLAFGNDTDPDEGGSWFSSVNGINLPSGSGWTNIAFPIGPNDLTRVQGSASYTSLMGNVDTLRLLHSTTPNSRGQQITATLGVDNIMAVGDASLEGDYNDNGAVDAADYVAWRDRLNQNVTIPNDSSPGSVTEADYSVWRSRFGQQSGSSAIAVPVPEPSSTLILLAVTASCAIDVRRRMKLEGRVNVST